MEQFYLNTALEVSKFSVYELLPCAAGRFGLCMAVQLAKIGFEDLLWLCTWMKNLHMADKDLTLLHHVKK